jgi:putative transposase
MQSMTGQKRLRLDLENYAAPGTVWHVTNPTFDRIPIFHDTDFAGTVVDSLQYQCQRCDANLLIYCLMPDHLHAVLTVGNVDLLTLMHGFKSYTTTLWRRRSGQRRLWQESFHEHGVRRTERMDDLVRYILENPVRAGLVADWQAHPWLRGSLLTDA